MSILMPPMHSLSQFDPFHSQAYSTAALFEAQEHYFQPAVYSPIGYATMHPFPVDPRWFNTSLSGHASAAPLPFSSAITTSDNIIPPHTPTDVLSLSPSSTIAPIPLSGSRDRSRSMSNRIRSLTNSSTSNNNNNTTSHATRLSRQSTGSQRIARRATVSSSPSVAAPHIQTPSAVHSPTGLPPPPPYMQSPTLHSPEDGHETRATKRRRTNDHDSSHLHTFTVVPEPPLLLTQTQTPHLSQIHAHHAGYAPMQTWAGPPSADPISHGVGSQHGFAQWPVPMAYFEAHDHHHSIRDDTTPLGTGEPHLLQFQSPTANPIPGPILYPSPSPDVDTPSVNPSQAFRKMEPESPQLHEHEHEHVPVEPVEPFEHGPTEFPPRPYAGGPAAISPWTYVKPVGKIYGSRLEQMPAIEARLAKLEDQVDQYLDLRASVALRNSQLPGLDFSAPLMDFGPRAPCRMFGGRIWPTALARRVRRTPRD